MSKKKIAVIGSGISGISASYFLSSKYDVHLFEKNNYLGGHTRTVKVPADNNLLIDTGFIVFNDRNYPDLIKFFDYLDVLTKNSDMSFAVSDFNYNIEYGGKNLKSLFAQYKNIFNISYLKMIYEIYCFYKLCKNTNLDNINNDFTVEDFLQNNKFSSYLKKLHVYPLISSIWSTNQKDVSNFPLKLFINFFNNHDLFNIKDKPQWKFVHGGSNSYIKKIIELNRFSFSLNTKIDKIIRSEKNIKIIKNNEEVVFDYIIIATHADQALQIINNPTKNEKEILSKFEYTKNRACLHSDKSMMPKNKKTWSSWNFIKSEKEDINFTLTYWMNNLQKLETSKEYFVTINPEKTPENTHNETFFTHPKFNLETMKSQSKLKDLQGDKNTFFCGAYHGYGFHEDGIQSAVYVSKMLDADIPWKRDNNFYNRLLY